jgi:uncharacterized membrane protein YeaQ/YmgE (transglycosylase-associated protein family)
MVQGLLGTVALGLVGSLLAELLRIAGPLTENRGPHNRSEWLGSLLYALCGLAVILYIPWDSGHTLLEVAAAGAAVPAVFPSAARTVVGLKNVVSPTSAQQSTGPRSWGEYMTNQFR